jgi:hypothetical protein
LDARIGKIHIWNFRAPDYPDPFPVYVAGDLDQRALPGRSRDSSTTSSAPR